METVDEGTRARDRALYIDSALTLLCLHYSSTVFIYVDAPYTHARARAHNRGIISYVLQNRI